MLGTALFFDVSQIIIHLLDFIPWVGFILSIIPSALISIFAWLTFYVWYQIRNVGLFESLVKKGAQGQLTKRFSATISKKLATWVGVGFAEILVGFLPGLTIGVIIMYFIVLADDKLEEKGILTEEDRKQLGLILKGHLNGKILKEEAIKMARQVAIRRARELGEDRILEMERHYMELVTKAQNLPDLVNKRVERAVNRIPVRL
jgi:hypothetical protein